MTVRYSAVSDVRNGLVYQTNNCDRASPAWYSSPCYRSTRDDESARLSCSDVGVEIICLVLGEVDASVLKFFLLLWLFLIHRKTESRMMAMRTTVTDKTATNVPFPDQ